MLITLEELVMEKSLCLSFLATNNEAKYEALLAGMAMVKKLGGEVVEVYSDSRLIVGQVNVSLKLGMNACKGILLRLDRLRPVSRASL